MVRRNDEIGDWIDGEESGSGLTLLGWGFGSVVAFVLAFASWQYAPPRSVGASRTEIGQPDPSEITGSIATSDTGQTSVQPSRTIGLGRLAPMPLAGDETLATSRDIDRLHAEIAEIRRRIVQIGMAGDGVSRRLDGIEERVTSMAGSSEPAPSAPAGIAPTEPPALEPLAAVEKPRSDARLAERLPTPVPRPAPPAAAPPSTPFDAEGPTTTGAVPKTIRPPETSDAGEAKPAKADTPADERVTKSSRLTIPAPPAAAPANPTPPPAVPAVSLPTVEEIAPAKPVRVVTAPPTAAAPAPPASTVPAAAIDLGGFRSLASLRRAWSDTTGRHTDLTKALEPLARLRETETGMEARLLAGPFADQTEAAKACLRLKALGATCAVTTFTGQPIGGLR